MRRALGTELTRLAVFASVLIFVGGAWGQERVTVFAAASTGPVLEDIAEAFSGQRGAAIVVVPAATSSLVRQVEAGAPAHLLISAAVVWMDRLDRAGLLGPQTRRAFLGNRLVFIAPAGSDVTLTLAGGAALGDALLKALGDSRLAVGDPEHVPAGIYAKEALTSLGAWPQIADRLAPGVNVTAALAYVARGEARIGIVYGSDAAATNRVRVVADIPAASHTPILYEVAAIGPPSPATARFLAFLFGSEARAVFTAHGFAPPPAPSAR